MINIKRFIDKVSAVENKNNKDLVIPLLEARGLRDELAKMLADFYESKTEKVVEEPEVKIEIKGGTFK